MSTEAIEKKIGYEFRDKHLLTEALTHPSANAGYNYERLEFLGDAVIELAVSETLYGMHKDSPEGYLTKLRAKIVCSESLAKIAVEYGINECLILGNGEEKSGGRTKQSILENATEALFGAVFLDAGFETAKVLAKNMLDFTAPDVEDYKSRVQEFLQKNRITDFEYRIIRENGPAHDRTFVIGFYVNGREFGVGTGCSKKAAEQMAARNAFFNFSTDEEE